MATLQRIVAATAAALAVAACGEREPRPPDASYLALDGTYMTHILPPPPLGSVLVARELAAVHAVLEARTPEEFERAREDAAVTVFRFADVLGADFNSETVPLTAELFRRVNAELGRHITTTKNCWRRPRPFEVDVTIRPVDDLLASTGMRTSAPPPFVEEGTPCARGGADPSYSFSYPSGHATFGTMAAILLAQMVPERREALFDRGREYGAARLIGGVHFPSDIEGGHILATAVAAMMLQEERFCADLDAARAELRAVLSLAELPAAPGACASAESAR